LSIKLDPTPARQATNALCISFSSFLQSSVEDSTSSSHLYFRECVFNSQWTFGAYFEKRKTKSELKGERMKKRCLKQNDSNENLEANPYV
jgi:hypothetical protein